MSNLPLEGVKVISLCNFVAGTTVTRYFSEFGAEVIQIESLAGDPWRYYGPANNVPANEKENPIYDIFNAHKKGIALDMKDPRGKDILFKLLEDADIFVTNTRINGLQRLGIDYDSIKERFPKLVYGVLTGYGSKGPDAAKPGYDGVAFFATSGLLRDATEASGYPMVPPASGGDIITGTTLYAGLLTAYIKALKTGKGDLVEVSLYGAATWVCAQPVLVSQPRFGDVYPKYRPGIKPLNTAYKCQDGEWLLLWIMQPERYFKTVCTILGIPEIADDPRFNTKAGILNNRAELIPILEHAFEKFDSAYLMEQFVANDITVTMAKHYNDAYTDPQALENDYMREVTFESGNKAFIPMIPIKSRNCGTIEFKRGPLLGEHTDEVLNRLHYTAGEIEALRADNVVK